MESAEEAKGSEIEEDTRCGVLGFHPKWLRIFASKKSYVILFGLVGMNQLAIGSYVVATITTLEKRFKIPSQTSGMITGGWDIGTIFSSITMAYIGSQGHKTRWVALGTLLTSIACFSQLLPYVLYGPGADAIALSRPGNTSQHSSSLSSSLCGLGTPPNEDCQDGGESVAPSLLIFMSQILIGIGTSMYWTLGVAYLDDNAKKSKAPWLIAISSTIRLFGSPIGFWLAARAVEFYVDPTLSPPITNKDPRWIGAWWLGWIPLGLIATFFSFILTLFPRVLPRASLRLKKRKRTSPKAENYFKGFRNMLKRLLKNPLLLCNTFSYVFYMFGVLGYWVFMPKYMETQFYMTATDANLVTGTMGLLSAALGVTLSGYVLTTFKPSARTIAGWNIFVEILGIASVFFYARLGCPANNFQGKWSPDGSWNLTEVCNSQCDCGPSVSYEPVCDVTRSATFYSPCHAGCTDVTYRNGIKVFTNCSCIPDTFTAVDSFCPVDCFRSLAIFLVLYCIISFFSSAGHAGLAIIQFRTVDPDDKSVSIAMSEMMCSALAYIPGPIVYGYLLDKACLVWGETCGERGNCWLYYGKTLRYYLNYTAAGFLSVALVFDFGTWYYSKNLPLYDEDDKNDNDDTRIKSSGCKENSISSCEDVGLQNVPK